MKRYAVFVNIVPCKSIVLVISLLALVLFSGCAPTINHIRASDSLFSKNPINRVAIIGDATIFWPTIKDTPAIGVGVSKRSLELFLPKIAQKLNEYGYDVVSAEPAGVGYYSSNREELMIYEDYEKYGNKKLIKLNKKDPIYTYPLVKENYALGFAIKNICEQFEYTRNYTQYGSNAFSPALNDVSKIRENISADTILYVKIVGRKFTEARRRAGVAADFGRALLSVSFAVATNVYVAGPSKSVHDSTGIFFTFIDAKSGEVLWHNYTISNIVPDHKDDMGAFLSSALINFPSKGAFLDASKFTNNIYKNIAKIDFSNLVVASGIPEDTSDLTTEEANKIKRLKTDDPREVKRVAREIFNQRYFHKKILASICYHLERYSANPERYDNHADMASWCCKVLGASGDKDYIPVLNRVMNSRIPRNLVQHARGALNKLK